MQELVYNCHCYRDNNKACKTEFADGEPFWHDCNVRYGII